MLMLALLPTLLMAQAAGGAVVRRPVKKTQTNTNTTQQPQKKKQNNTAGKKTEKQEAKQQESKRQEAAGYDVSFSCNVPSAAMSIDGVANGTATGTRFLKTGSHSVRLTADGYEPLSRTITVNRSSTSFSFSMKRRSPVLI